MIKAIDHLVVVVPDLDGAIRNYTGLGFTVTPGGKHPIGSHNALIPFADGSYIELIAFTARASPHPWNLLLRKGGGLIDFCVQTNDLSDTLASFGRAGVEMSEPFPLSRERPDGYTLRWTLSIPQPPWPGIVPFLIQDETPRKERVPQNTSHPNGAIGIGNLTLAVTDRVELRRVYEAILQQTGQPFTSRELDAIGFTFRIGKQSCTLASPKGSGGSMAKWLNHRGPSPYSAAINAPASPAQFLDVEKSMNARLSLGQVVS
jgi:hypothetical protein